MTLIIHISLFDYDSIINIIHIDIDIHIVTHQPQGWAILMVIDC